MEKQRQKMAASAWQVGFGPISWLMRLEFGKGRIFGAESMEKNNRTLGRNPLRMGIDMGLIWNSWFYHVLPENIRVISPHFSNRMIES